jgi:hypothetical protein
VTVSPSNAPGIRRSRVYLLLVLRRSGKGGGAPVGRGRAGGPPRLVRVLRTGNLIDG